MRLIDADKAIEIWKEKDFIKFVGQEEKAKMLLDVLPTEPMWIPVSERLPEEEVDVLICNKDGDIEISRGSYSTEAKDYWIWYTSGWRFGKAVAWMPLPQPYKAESEE